MILAVTLVAGFKKEVQNKIFGFWGHVHIHHLDATISGEPIPISKAGALRPDLLDLGKVTYKEPVTIFNRPIGNWTRQRQTKAGLKRIQVYANKPGIIKINNQLEGMLLKGIGDDFGWEFLNDFIKEGEPIELGDSTFSRDILISRQTATRMKLQLGDVFTVYFIERGTQRPRRLKVKGIYKTGIEEYDRQFAMVDIKLIQQLNGWSPDQISGFEIFVENPDDIQAFGDYLYYNEIGAELYARTIMEVDPNLFGWLNLSNMNQNLVIGIMVLISIINMVSALMILILESTNMIGILKSLGMRSRSIRGVFLYHAGIIIGFGLLIGNLVGLGLALLQKYTGIIRLPEEHYYVSTAPIHIDWVSWLILNLGTIALILLVLIIPSYLAKRISPVQAIRFS